MRGLWIFASLVAFLAILGGTTLPAAAQQEPPREPRQPACVMHNGSGVVVAVPPEHTAACFRYGRGGLMCRVAAVTVVVSGGVAGTTVTGTGKCGANILQATATSPAVGASAAANGGPTAKGNPADCVATIVQPGGGLIDPTLSYDIRCVFIDP